MAETCNSLRPRYGPPPGPPPGYDFLYFCVSADDSAVMEVLKEGHEFSVSFSPTDLSPTDSGRLSIRRLLRFSPIQVLKSPDPSSPPRCSLLARRQSEWQFRRRHPPNSVAQRWSEQLSSPSKEPAPSRSHRYLPNSGLGNRNCLNTMKASVSVVFGTAFQGEMSNADHQAVILIENMLEHFQILVEVRCRCSRG